MMRDWLRRSMNRASRHSQRDRNQGAASRVGPHLWPSAAEPSTRYEAFHSHWSQVCNAMRLGSHHSEQTSTVFNNMDQMLLLLLTEVNAQDQPNIGPILDLFFSEDILDKVLSWSLSAQDPNQAAQCILNMLKLFEGVVTQSSQCLLIHKPILHPLLKLLDSCGASNSNLTELEKHFVLLLNQICTKIANDSRLLEFFFDERENGSRFLVFTLLIPYLHEDGDLGQLSRDAILLILSCSRDMERVGRFVGGRCNFCPVLATGLSGLFSQLPRRLTSVLLVSDDWHRISQEQVDVIPAISAFYNALLFCNAVVQVGHPNVSEQLLEYVYQGFLISVVGPALEEPGLEELISGSAYLDLSLRTVTEPALMSVFVRFLVLPRDDDGALLDVLVPRIASKSKLGLISLALFHTLVDLNCEDLMLHLILKYLIPCNHMMASQIPSLADLDLRSVAASKFLALTPRSVRHTKTGQSPLPVEPGWFQNGVEAFNNGSLAPGAPLNVAEHKLAYLEELRSGPIGYMMEASVQVGSCYEACQCWSQPYDGVIPGVGGSEGDPSSSNQSSPSRAVYTTRRHSSMQGLQESSAVDLTVLGPQDLDTEREMDFGSGQSSLVSTPRYRKGVGSASMPVDYFKLAFEEMEEDMVSHPTDSQGDESDTVSFLGSSCFVLRGWSEVKDLDTFIEVLNRVRTPGEIAKCSLEDHLKFIEEAEQRLKAQEEEEEVKMDVQEDKQEEEKDDSGMGLTESGESVDIAGSPEKEAVRKRWLGIPVVFQSQDSPPTVGPFLTVLLQKLEEMMENSLFVNLQLTGVIARLACYPQPLLRSFLLNTNLVFQPSIRTLYQILSSLRQRIDAYAFESVNNFEALVVRGRKFLSARDRRFHISPARDRSPAPGPNNNFTDNLGPAPNDETKPRSSSDPQDREKKNSKRSRSVEVSRGLKTNRVYTHKNAESTLEAMRVKTMVYCAIVFEEFLKELAAISQEHSISGHKTFYST